MSNIIKYIGTITLAALILIGTGIVWEKALAGQEQFECESWQSQARTFSGFYLTTWQKAQCDHYKININAPVQ